MSQLFKMFGERKEQLHKQENIDTILVQLNRTCPQIVSDYLLLQRKITRNQQYKIINTNFLSLYDEMQTQLNLNKKITIRFLEQPGGIRMTCADLSQITKEG